MARGFKVADVYAELNLDRDTLRQGLRDLPGQMGADADRAGRELGKKMTDGLAKAVEQSSARLAKARRAEQTATDAVKLAEVRLDEARAKGTRTGSTLLALEQKLEQAQRRLADSQSATVTSTRKLEDAQRKLASAIGDIGKDLGPSATRAGDDAGGKLALGMRMSIIRNSPLIAAAIGGVLAAGAPLLTVAATGLFAGIGIIAAAQSEKVGHAWSTTWSGIQAQTIKSASAIEPVLIKVADNVGDSFQRMGPRLQGIFTDAAPQIEVFADGILDLAENALPGLENAIHNGMPVTQGFADFMGKTGTGLSDLFDAITEHAPASGQVLSGLGDSVGILLPLIGELVGQGAELAADVLPLVNGGLGNLLTITRFLGPALPTVGAGFLAFKAANVATGWIEGLGTKLTTFSTTHAGRAATAAGRVGTALGAIGSAAPLIGVGVGLIGAAFQKGAEEADAFSTRVDNAYARLREGGAAAVDARAELDFLTEASSRVGNSFGTFGSELPDRIADAEANFRRLWEAMDPLQQAQSKVAEWSSTLRDRLGDESTSTADLEAAKRRLTYWQQQVADAANREQMELHGVTEEMTAQADAALALADADLAHRNAVDQAEDSLAAYDEAVAKYGASSEEASDAARAWEGDLSRVVATAGQLATDALPANMDANSKLALSQIAQRDTLRELSAQFGDKLPVALQQALASLEQTTAGYDLAKLEADRLAAATGTASEKMQKLGQTEAVPKIKAEASIFAGIHAATGQKLKQLDESVATPKAHLNASVFAGAHADTMSKIKGLDAQRPTPSAWLNNGPFGSVWGAVMGQIGQLGGQRPTPAVMLADYASGGISKVEAKLLGLRDRTVYITTVERTVKAKAGGGRVWDSPIYAAIGRKVQGPGGPTDDLVPATGPNGADYRLSPGEWIVNELRSRQQGDTKMAALNDGRADIVMRAPGFAGGGLPMLGGMPPVDVPDELYERLTEAVTVGVEGSLGEASPQLTQSILRATPYVTAAVRSAGPQLTGAVQQAGPTMTRAVAAAAPALTNAVSAAAGSISSAIRAALPAAAPSSGARPTTPGPLPAGFGSQSYQFDESRQNDPAYIAWWNGLLAAGWRGTSSDGQERLYSPYARGGRFPAGAGLLVGEEGRELVRFDQPGEVIPAAETRQALSGSKTIHVEHLDVHLQGFDIRDRAEIRRFARALRQELLNVDREDS